ncbi:MAG: endonuclease/exonuclease/phosphatase family protein [Pasteurellaceae bacterium]|nr:endonuclease/exonuclease/phosphatase family protein [Pasteurellaceae bacterium]
MKKTLRFLLVILLLGIGAVAYLWTAFTLYEPPFVQFRAADEIEYQPKLPFCMQSTRPPEWLTQKRLRFLVWNMHKGADAGWQQDLARLAQDRDFLLLQEVSSQQNLEHTLPIPFQSSLYGSAFAYQGEKSGVQMLSRFSPDLYCVASQAEPWIRIPKVASAMRFPLNEQSALLIVNVHFINFEWQPQAYRSHLDKMMQLIAKHNGPVILTGDFNSWSQARLAVLQELTTKYQLNAAKFMPDHRLYAFGNPLDQFFVRGAHIVQASTETVQSSDHNPLLVEIELD